jgi:hypothetical protein
VLTGLYFFIISIALPFNNYFEWLIGLIHGQVATHRHLPKSTNDIL